SLTGWVLSVPTVPSGFITSPPAAHTDGQNVNTPQPPQLPASVVPLMSPPSAWIFLACSASSLSVVGPFSGSSPALVYRSLFQKMTDRSMVCGIAYFLSWYVPSLMCAGASASLNGR